MVTTKSGIYCKILHFASKNPKFKELLVSYDKIGSCINEFLNLLQKSDKMLSKPHILSRFSTGLINSVIHESCI